MCADNLGMQSFLSTSKGNDTAATQTALLSKASFDNSLLAKLGPLPVPQNNLVVADPRTLIIQGRNHQQSVVLQSTTELFADNSQHQPKYLVSTQGNSTGKHAVIAALAVIKPLNFAVSTTKASSPLNQVLQASKPTVIQNSANASLSVPVNVLTSTANSIQVKLDGNRDQTGVFQNVFKLPVANPTDRPVSGQRVWLNVQIDPVDQRISVSWSEKPSDKQRPLTQLAQHSPLGNALKALLLSHKAQIVQIPKKLLPSESEYLPIAASKVTAIGKVSEHKLVVNSQRLIPVALIDFAEKQSSATLKTDFALPQKQFGQFINQAPLPRLNTKVVTRDEESRLVKEVLTNLAPREATSLNGDHSATSLANALDPQKVNTAIKFLLRQLLAKSDLKTNLDTLIPQKPTSEISPKPAQGQLESVTNDVTAKLPSSFTEKLNTLLKPELKKIQNFNEATSLKTTTDTKQINEAQNLSKNVAASPQSSEFGKSDIAPQVEDAKSPQQRLASELRQTVAFPFFAISPTTILSAIQQPAPNSLATALIRILAALPPSKAADVTDGGTTRERLISSGKTATPSRTSNAQAAAPNIVDANIRRQIFSNLINHQLSKLASAESTLNGQEQIYYALPAVGELKTPTEFLVKPIADEDEKNVESAATTKAWQLTMKLNIGELGTILATSTLNEKELNVDLYTDEAKILRALTQSTSVLKQRLQTLGLPVVNVFAQMGVIPDTLKPQSLHLLETSA